MWAHRGCWVVSGKVASTLSLRNVECRKRGGWHRSGSLIMVPVRREDNSVWNKTCNELSSLFQGGTCALQRRLDFNCAYKWHFKWHKPELKTKWRCDQVGRVLLLFVMHQYLSLPPGRSILDAYQVHTTMCHRSVNAGFIMKSKQSFVLA